MCKDSDMKINQICQTSNIIFHFEEPFWVNILAHLLKDLFFFISRITQIETPVILNYGNPVTNPCWLPFLRM